MNLEKELNRVLKDIDDTPLTFGKHRGETPNQIAEEDPSYLIWMYENIEIKHCSQILYVACRMDEDEEDNPDLVEVDDFMRLQGK